MKVCSVCQRCFDDAILSCSEENHGSLTDGREGSVGMIPNYRLELLRESDAAGETYRAAGTILEKTYLVKIFSSQLFDDAAKKRFLSETESLATIYHPNLARVFEAGTLADGSPYVVTEFIEAQTLRDCLENTGKPTEVTAVTVARQAAEGLEALHAAGVLHRNLKPENIILTSDAENKFLVKLQNIDFGALRQRQILSKGDLYLTDVRYFSPEQGAGRETDAQTDVYSLGVVLYEMLAGRVPFDAPYSDAIIAKHQKETPPEIKIHSFDIRMLLTHTLTDALQKQTRTRIKTANALTRRLRHIEQLATHSSTPPPAVAYPAAMNKAAVVFTPPVKAEKTAPAESPAAIENLIPAEKPVVVESKAAVENLPPAANEIVIEEPEFIETPVSFEIAAENVSARETENDSPIIDESETAVDVLFANENPAHAEELSSVENSPLENESSFEMTGAVEAQSAEESPELVEDETNQMPAVFETETADEILIAADEKTADEVFVTGGAPAVAEIPAEIQIETVPETREAAPVFIDYTTTKLPPLETIAVNFASAGEPEIETVRSLQAALHPDIHKTSEPVLVEWEQPDDVPTVTAALNISRKERADVQFVPDADVIERKERDAVDADESEYVSESSKTRRDYASVRPVLSYDDAGTSWNLPGKRAFLTGAAIAGLLIIAVGGTFLNRRIQSARADHQTTAKTSQSEKTAAKPVEPAKIAVSDNPSAAKPEAVNISNPAAAAESPDTSDLPNYEPRATIDKPASPAAPISVKKRAVTKLSENAKTPPPAKTEAAEVFDKKGNPRAPDKKSANSQTPAKSDVFTRPRVVKNPR